MGVAFADYDDDGYTDVVSTSVGYAGSSDLRVPFGLGPDRLVKRLEIRRSSGARQELEGIHADQILTVVEVR